MLGFTSEKIQCQLNLNVLVFYCFGITYLSGGVGGRDLLSADVLIVISMFCCLDVEWGACGSFGRISTVDEGDENH